MRGYYIAQYPEKEKTIPHKKTNLFSFYWHELLLGIVNYEGTSIVWNVLERGCKIFS